MNTEKMTIHKALVELKTLDSRIGDAINESTFVLANKHSNKQYLGVPVDEHLGNLKSNFQKINDLINRRTAIKRAVVFSNATTVVNINGVEYTVAEAIEMKNHGMDFYKMLLVKMAQDYTNAKRTVEERNGDDLEERANNYIATLYGNSDMKNLSNDVQKLRNDFITAQTYDLLDPIDVEKVIEELDAKINNFFSEVDSALSVSNALTTLEISY